MSDSPLASLSLTHVHYNPHSQLSYICAWLALVPQALCVTYATLMWSSREAEVIMMFAGQMLCEGLNWVLKRWIKEERPSQMHGKGYGMPSSHAQFVAFFSTFLTLFLLLRHSPHSHPPSSYSPTSSSSTSTPPPTPPTPFSHRLLLCFAAILSAAAVAQSRIYLNYHTPKQVYAGVGAGVVFAIFWFILTGIVRKIGLLEWGLELGISRALRVRDLVIEEDIWEAGWERFEIRRMRRKRDVKAKSR